MVIWITGISDSGKSTLCEAIHKRIKPALPSLVLVDGDIVRGIFGHDLDHSEPDRQRQIKRIQRLALELDRQGMTVLVAALYAHPDLLDWNRASFSGYFEVYLRASLELVRSRDSKGLYAKVDRGDISNVVGVDIPWHEPQRPDLVIDAAEGGSPDAMARQVIAAVPVLQRMQQTVADEV
jgi:adenylylsulfate kinase-like enzyme